MPAICEGFVVADLCAPVAVAVFQSADIRGGLAAKGFGKDAVFISEVCSGVGVLHVVTPAVERGGGGAPCALHDEGLVLTFFNGRFPLDAAIDQVACLIFEGNQSGLDAGGGETFADLYFTSQILAIACIVPLCIDGLLCQCFQGFGDFFIRKAS